MAAAGGSYGGYMVNWILGHTQRFKALVSHAGVFDLASEFGATEELWFPLWEYGGTPWDNPEHYAKWSPSHYVQGLQDPHARHPRRAGFPRPLHAGPATLHRPANAKSAVQAAALPRRRPLGPEAAEQPPLVQAPSSIGSIPG